MKRFKRILSLCIVLTMIFTNGSSFYEEIFRSKDFPRGISYAQDNLNTENYADEENDVIPQESNEEDTTIPGKEGGEETKDIAVPEETGENKDIVSNGGDQEKSEQNDEIEEQSEVSEGISFDKDIFSAGENITGTINYPEHKNENVDVIFYDSYTGEDKGSLDKVTLDENGTGRIDISIPGYLASNDINDNTYALKFAVGDSKLSVEKVNINFTDIVTYDKTGINTYDKNGRFINDSITATINEEIYSSDLKIYLVNPYNADESIAVENTGSKDIEISIPEDLKWAKAVLRIESGSNIYTVPFPLNSIVVYNRGSIKAGESFVINLNIPEMANSEIEDICIKDGDSWDSTDFTELLNNKSLDGKGGYTSEEISLVNSEEVSLANIMKYSNSVLRIHFYTNKNVYYCVPFINVENPVSKFDIGEESSFEVNKDTIKTDIEAAGLAGKDFELVIKDETGDPTGISEEGKFGEAGDAHIEIPLTKAVETGEYKLVLESEGIEYKEIPIDIVYDPVSKFDIGEKRIFEVNKDTIEAEIEAAGLAKKDFKLVIKGETEDGEEVKTLKEGYLDESGKTSVKILLTKDIKPLKYSLVLELGGIKCKEIPIRIVYNPITLEADRYDPDNFIQGKLYAVYGGPDEDDGYEWISSYKAVWGKDVKFKIYVNIGEKAEKDFTIKLSPNKTQGIETDEIEASGRTDLDGLATVEFTLPHDLKLREDQGFVYYLFSLIVDGNELSSESLQWVFSVREYPKINKTADGNKLYVQLDTPAWAEGEVTLSLNNESSGQGVLIDGKSIYSLKLDDKGQYEGEISLPDKLDGGSYSLQIRYGEVYTAALQVRYTADITINVNSLIFKNTTFDLNIRLDRESYKGKEYELKVYDYINGKYPLISGEEVVLSQGILEGNINTGLNTPENMGKLNQLPSGKYALEFSIDGDKYYGYFALLDRFVINKNFIAEGKETTVEFQFGVKGVNSNTDYNIYLYNAKDEPVTDEGGNQIGIEGKTSSTSSGYNSGSIVIPSTLEKGLYKFILKINGEEEEYSASFQISDAIVDEVRSTVDVLSDVVLTNHYSMDWVSVGVNRAGKSLPSSYLESTENYIVMNKGILPNITDYERITLGVTAAGGDPTNIGGYNLIEKIYNGDIEGQGNNGVAFGLIAVDSKKYDIPADAKWNRDRMIQYLLNNECTNGGWQLGGKGTDPDPDMSGMVMTALAPYNNKDYPQVQAAIARAVDALSQIQRPEGGFASWGTVNSESCSQVIMGLCTNGVDPTGPEFTKNKNLVEALLSFKTADGGIAHTEVGGSLATNGMASEQALYALDQYIFFVEGKGSIYDWTHDDEDEHDRIELGKKVKISQDGKMYFAGGIDVEFPQSSYNPDSSTIMVSDVTDSKKPGEESSLKLHGKIIEISLEGVNESYDILLRMPVNSGEDLTKSAIYIFNNASNKFEYLGNDVSNKKLTVNITNNSSIYGVFGDETKPTGVKFDYEVSKNKVTLKNITAVSQSGIKYFEIYRDGKYLGNAEGDSFVDPDALSYNTEYKYKIRAVDNLGNISDFSDEIIIKTKDINDPTDPNNPNPPADPNDKEVTVQIRIEGYDHTVVSMRDIKVSRFGLDDYLGPAGGSSATPSKGWGKEKFKGPTVAHATIRAMEAAGVDYDYQDYGWSLYLAMVDGDREFDYRSTSGWMYRVNRWLPNYGSQEYYLKDGDVIEWYFGAYGFENWYTKISANKTSVKTGEELTVTLTGESTDLNGESGRGNTVKGKVDNAEIYVNEDAFSVDGEPAVTDENGKAVLKFNSPGTYYVSAERFSGEGIRNIIRPVPVKITVTGEEIPQKEVTGEEEGKDKVKPIKNSEYEIEYKTVTDPNSTEDQILRAVESAVGKLARDGKEIKEEKTALKIAQDMRDVLTIMNKAADRITTEEGMSIVLSKNTQIQSILIRASEKAKLQENRKEIEETSEKVLEFVLKLINKTLSEKKTEELINETITNQGKIVKNIGKEYGKKIETISAKLVEKGSEKLSTVKLSKEERTIGEDYINNKFITTAKTIEQKLKEQNIEPTRSIQNKEIIEIGKEQGYEIGLAIAKEALNKAKEEGINIIEIKTEMGAVSLSQELINRGEKLDIKIIKIADGVEISIKDEAGKEVVLSKPIEISLPYTKEIKVQSNIGVLQIGNEGDKEELGGAYDSTDNIIKFITMNTGRFIPQEGYKEFEDIRGNDIIGEAVRSLSSKGIIKGRTEKEYAPNENITRGEFAVLISRMMKYDEEGNKELPFKDVSKDKWYYKSVCAVYGEGLIDGKTKEIFEPQANITNEEMAKIIGNILKNNFYREQKEEEIKYTDADEISDWARKGVAIGKYNGIFEGLDENSFNPKEKATRGNTAVMLYRLYELILNK